MRELGIKAHGCGADDPRKLRREHCHIVGDDGLLQPLDELYPYPALRA